ncbi:MAG: L-glutamate gamma-semialdehyde dehydrogenase [Chloroflexi bacterium]|nr:L-glutamate gamma-semialdehyde dehydrogenase [Chloroflexota bacterium]OJV94201.1 MAG: L-glutamate gamma-semialdehyde dehydrogenase [Chloroflexi bacterium 54-19]
MSILEQPATGADRAPYKNEPLTDFSQPKNRLAMEAALAKVASQLGQTLHPVVGGKKLESDKFLNSYNPARPDELIARFYSATSDQAEQAVQVASETFKTWQKVPYTERAEYLFKAADLMRERKHEFSAWMVFEIGKNWNEADADTAEAIDFLEFYAREMLRLGGPQPVVQVEGEKNHLAYVPLGVGVVIPPWNFPLAITTGMTSAAIVTGNTVILKPSSVTPVIAYRLFELFEEVGLPAGVFNFLPGSGGAIGDLLVDHPKTRFISFTGSKEVGLRIFDRASKTAPGQIWLKRTVLEMGGKDSVVVDETADLNAAASAIVTSAFGFQGQKCSAGSRAILVDSIYDEVLEKVVEKVNKLELGPTDEKNFDMGPVSDEKAYKKINEYIEIGKGEGKLVAGDKNAVPETGYFIPPTVFSEVDPQARIAQEEIFGPVLAVIRARDFDHALEIANGTEYGLTGALFSQDPARLDRAETEFHVGNLYFNRKCTGALVGVQPFGGFNMSGTDSKAGGQDYLLLFLQGKSIARRS